MELTKRMETMQRYTLRGLIHDAKIFNQLRLEYRRTKKEIIPIKPSSTSPTAFFILRVGIGFALCSVGLLIALAGWSQASAQISSATPAVPSHSRPATFPAPTSREYQSHLQTH